MSRPGLGLVASGLWLAACVSEEAPLFDVVREGPPVEHRGVSRGVAWGDFDNDGDPDLFVTHPVGDGPPRQNALYRNDQGLFVPIASAATESEPGSWQGAVWIDVDGDGDLDLHVVGRNGAGSALFENRGGGELVLRDPDPLGDRVRSASMACWADVDADGLLDVFVVGYGDDHNWLFRNTGSWEMEPVPLPLLATGDGAARSCLWADLNADFLPELVVASAREPNVLLSNLGGMALVPDTTTGLHLESAYSYGLSAADANGDGLLDVFVANFDAGNALFLGRQDGGLEPVALDGTLESAASKGHVWADFDMDGLLDLYLGSGTPRPGMLNRLYLGTPSGVFRLSAEGEYSTHADTSAAIAAADFDLDGDLDIFVANWGSSASPDRLYANTTSGRNWLKVRLEGVRSNRMGIGARASVLVSIGTERRWMYRWLDASTGYAGQNEPIMHFGLGAAVRADSLVVEWPSGVIDRFSDVSAGAVVQVREGG